MADKIALEEKADLIKEIEDQIKAQEEEEELTTIFGLPNPIAIVKKNVNDLQKSFLIMILILQW